MRHIEELFIKRFRRIKNAKLTNLNEINLLVGNNNSGKTSVLEAVELFLNPASPANIFQVARLRERNAMPSVGRLSLFECISWLFPLDNYQSKRDDIEISFLLNGKEIEIGMKLEEELYFEARQNSLFEENDLDGEIVSSDSSDEEQRIQKVNVRYKDSSKKEYNKNIFFTEKDRIPFFKDEEKIISSNFVTPIDHRVRSYMVRDLNEVILSGYRPKVINALKYFDNNIVGIELLMPKSSNNYRSFPIPFIDHKIMGLTPVTMFGDGVRKALTLASALVRCQNGILLIDELETGIHTSVLGEYFSWLVNASKEFNVQIFATTHSLEAIDAVLGATEEISKISVYRLEQSEDGNIVKRFSGEKLKELRYHFGQDVR
ncbi:AAA family ATPase [Anaerobacillus isosaccharinicus]|uniref:AAA family ATPase n=1 Tax=Anaerobacillus isosaccharinicus TaxID=1532552 RepID=A0A1S2MDC1_9BACI|nr:ATP-binding protein [Anaerobacillus isosaccharinicus]MBA5585173.1 AAA family ATPase [Anaerobacillus isosaccharinicus]QOY36490.1 AAA family ATPase [Anaerobacillus isosaccharinicus]